MHSTSNAQGFVEGPRDSLLQVSVNVADALKAIRIVQKASVATTYHVAVVMSKDFGSRCEPSELHVYEQVASCKAWLEGFTLPSNGSSL